MRTNIVIDNELMNKVLDTGDFKTKREAVEEGLRLLLRLENQKGLRKLRGKLPWTGSLRSMRANSK